MYKTTFQLFMLVLITNCLLANGLYERRKRGGNPKNKNYDLCQRVFDVSNATIIKTSESVKNGAKYLGAAQVNTREACERSCCSTDSCNVAVLEEKSKTATDGDCFLFDCGSLDDFKCVFAVHGSYVSLGMMVNRVDLEKTRIHEQSKHELDLKILKTPPAAQQPDVPVQAVTTVAVPPQQWSDDQDPQMSGGNQQMTNSKATQQQDNGGLAYQQPSDNSIPMYDYPQQQQPQQPQQPQQQQQQRPYQRQPPVESQMQRQSSQFQPPQQVARPPSDASRSSSSAGQQQYREPELQRKRPPVGDNPAAQNSQISKPKALMDSRIDQPQRPPIFSDQQQAIRQNQQPRSKCNKFQWACASGDQCVALYDRCSGIAQCSDGSDEQNCDQVGNQASDSSTYDDGNGQNRNVRPPGQQPMQQAPPQRQQQAQQNGGSWGNYYNNGNAYQGGNQQRNSPVQQNGNGYGGVQQGQQRQQQQQQNNYVPQASQQKPPNQRMEFSDARPVQQPKPQQPSPVQSVSQPDSSTRKESRVEYISIQKLDSAAPTNGGETASLAIVMLGLGMSILALCLLFLSCRLRKVRRRMRRGKVLDTEEGEFLVNGMYL